MKNSEKPLIVQVCWEVRALLWAVADLRGNIFHGVDGAPHHNRDLG